MKVAFPRGALADGAAQGDLSRVAGTSCMARVSQDQRCLAARSFTIAQCVYRKTRRSS